MTCLGGNLTRMGLSIISEITIYCNAGVNTKSLRGCRIWMDISDCEMFSQAIYTTFMDIYKKSCIRSNHLIQKPNICVTPTNVKSYLKKKRFIHFFSV